MPKETERFFDSFYYSEAEFATSMSRLQLTGVRRHYYEALYVAATGAMSVQVQRGEAFVEGFWYELINFTTLPINQETFEDYRIDYVVVRAERNLNRFTLMVLEGEPGGDPPELTRNSSYYDIVLAEVTVDQGVTQITQAKIRDTRPDIDLCGYTGVGIARDFTDTIAEGQPGFTFASNIGTGVGINSRSGGLELIADGVHSHIVYDTASMATRPLLGAGAPELGADWTVSLPPSPWYDLNGAIQGWDRRYQLILGRSYITTEVSTPENPSEDLIREVWAQWGWRVGGQADGTWSGALELWRGMGWTSNPGGATGAGRPTAPSVPLSIDGNGRWFINEPSAASIGGTGWNAQVTIAEPRINAAGLLIDNRSGFASPSVATLAIYSQIGKKPDGSDSTYAAKRHDLAPDDKVLAAILYQNTNAAIQGMIIGPEGASKGIVFDKDGRVGIHILPTATEFDFNIRGTTRFGTATAFAADEDADVHIWGDLTVYGDFSLGGGDDLEFGDVIVDDLTVNGNLDVYGYVHFHKGPDTDPYSFLVDGDTRIQSTLRVDISARAPRYYVGMSDNLNYIEQDINTGLEIFGRHSVRFWVQSATASPGYQASWNGNWHGTPNADNSKNNLGLTIAYGATQNSRWTRIFCVEVDEAPITMMMATEIEEAAQPMLMRLGDDGEAIEVPKVAVSRIRGMEDFGPDEALDLALRTYAIKYYAPMYALDGADEATRAAVPMSARELHISALEKDVPAELSPPGAGYDPMKFSLTAIMAIHALNRKNGDLQAQITELRGLVEALAARLPEQ